MKRFSIIALSIFVLATTAPASFAAYGLQIKTAHCSANKTLPDAACTPGAVLTSDVKTICVKGYTSTVRNVPLAERKKVFAEYGIPYSKRGGYEVDHLISLELGGGNDISNLWPESYYIANGSRVKDKFENYLNAQVCGGKISIADAQAEISGDWLKYYQSSISVKTSAPGQSANAVAPETKKSSTGLCHEKGTTYYARTTVFTPYASLADCLKSGGHLPAK